jgi:hypothetical protein
MKLIITEQRYREIMREEVERFLKKMKEEKSLKEREEKVKKLADLIKKSVSDSE